jgi:hypothetical protein
LVGDTNLTDDEMADVGKAMAHWLLETGVAQALDSGSDAVAPGVIPQECSCNEVFYHTSVMPVRLAVEVVGYYLKNVECNGSTYWTYLESRLIQIVDIDEA